MTANSSLSGPNQRSEIADASGARHLMSVLVEDYFQVGAFRSHIETRQWDRFESRLFRNTRAALDLLARHDVRATFFVLGWNAERWPELVRLIVDEGHEVANGGYHHDNVREMDRNEFCERMQRSREAIEAASGQPVLGYRMAEGWLNRGDLWLLDHLITQGYAYDSSLLPRGREFHSQPWRQFAHEHKTDQGRLWELPPASLRLPGIDLPIAGGNYFRQIPHTLLKHAIARWDRCCEQPLMLYFHVWELDTEQPEVSAADRLTQVRHYRNLGKMNWVLADYLSKHRFGTVAEFLGQHDADFWKQCVEERAASPEYQHAVNGSARIPDLTAEADTAPEFSADATPVTVVIPCYNEEQTVPYLAKTLDGLRRHLAPEVRPRFTLVDDGSSDRTWELLNQHWSHTSDVSLIRHPENAGVARAIQTGIASAETDIVCSMDCDCSYDPHGLKEMIPLLTEGIDLVTASPYHARGEVRNVPGWRLVLSRGASFMYRLVLGQPLATYTSCFRVYRRRSLDGLTIDDGNFLGIAEMLGKLILAGGRVVEYPATLSVRLFGHSKMKTLRTIYGHLGLLRRLLWIRLTSDRPTSDSAPSARAQTVSVVSPARSLARPSPSEVCQNVPNR